MKKLAISFALANAALSSGNSNSTKLSTRLKNDSEGSPVEASSNSLLVTEEAIASLKASTLSLFAISGPTPPNREYISTMVSSRAPSSACGPQIDSRKISLTVFLPANSSGKPAAILPAVSSALQIASPIISQILTKIATRTFSIACHIAALAASIKILKISRLKISSKPEFNLGRTISLLLRQNGNSISLTKSITLGVNNGGRGQSNRAMTFEIISAPGNPLRISTSSRRLSVYTSIKARI